MVEYFRVFRHVGFFVFYGETFGIQAREVLIEGEMMRISPYINQGLVLINPIKAFGKITELKKKVAGEPASGRIETVISQGG